MPGGGVAAIANTRACTLGQPKSVSVGTSSFAHSAKKRLSRNRPPRALPEMCAPGEGNEGSGRKLPCSPCLPRRRTSPPKGVAELPTLKAR
eukprot:4096403-Alexandrium_andersonii.AAC.1